MTDSGAEPTSDRVSRLIQLLAEEWPQGTSIAIAETLWLAMQIEPVAEVIHDGGEVQGSGSFPPVQHSAVIDVGPAPEPSLPPEPPPALKANLATSTPQAGVLPPHVLPVWLADPAMLTDALAIIRALKPLLKKVPAGISHQLNEPATADTIARTRLCLPVLEPAQEPWFDIILVVDRGSSMYIWQRLVQDVARILRRYGAFRNVQVLDLIVNPDSPTPTDAVQLMTKPDRPGHRPSELLDQRGRRIAIVLSDCAGKYWWDGTLLPMLQEWGAVMPTVVWQMLPAWMWKRTALGRGTAVAIYNDNPGVANQRLKVRIQERHEPDDANQRLSLPVVTSEVRDLARWSLMVAGDRRESIPGFLLPQQGGTVPRSRTLEEIARDQAEHALDEGLHTDFDAAFNQALETLARDRVERFLELSSPQAQRLIMLLAAAPVITLPVVRLIRDAMLNDTPSPLPVAEVFLSGLLLRLPGQEEQAFKQVIQPETDPAEPEDSDPETIQLEWPDRVQYDFAPKVRNILLETLPAIDTLEVINSVSAAIERRWNRISDVDFRAFLTQPALEVPEELQGMRSFASVTADILEQLGGDYAHFAQQLRQGTGPEPVSEQPVSGLSHFPALEEFEFIDAQLIDATAPDPEPIFPPPLQTEEFTVITVQVEPDPTLNPEPQPDLDTFEFTVVTLHPQTTQHVQETATPSEWFIQRRQHWAYRFFEALPDDFSLEMVAIPGGTFLMGSPADEPERYSNESPQHEVTVAPFFMSRYPITQSQWLTVTVMPPVDRELNPDPSYFKSNSRPVEQVSWYDAVEFCVRLSVHTGREYRLPTEAEWEYACRAGTTTPFHVGDMITTEVANYNGRSYNGSSQDERRGETTLVNEFETANKYGLCDMYGNVWEWCADHWHNNYEGAPIDGSTWLSENEGANRVVRGGSWLFNPRYCRSASRFGYSPTSRYSNIGFRVVCSAPKGL